MTYATQWPRRHAPYWCHMLARLTGEKRSLLHTPLHKYVVPIWITPYTLLLVRNTDMSWTTKFCFCLIYATALWHLRSKSWRTSKVLKFIKASLKCRSTTPSGGKPACTQPVKLQRSVRGVTHLGCLPMPTAALPRLAASQNPTAHPEMAGSPHGQNCKHQSAGTWTSPESLQECRVSPQPLTQNLDHNKIPRRFICTLKLEKHLHVPQVCWFFLCKKFLN